MPFQRRQRILKLIREQFSRDGDADLVATPAPFVAVNLPKLQFPPAKKNGVVAEVIQIRHRSFS
jgi:hypothetical protein